MSAQLYFITTGKASVSLQGMGFGKQIRNPNQNVKHFGVTAYRLDLEAMNPDVFTNWGVIELKDMSPNTGFITVTIDTDHWTKVGTVQIQLKMNGQVVLNDNFQSGPRGPFGNPLVVKKFPIANF